MAKVKNQTIVHLEQNAKGVWDYPPQRGGLTGMKLAGAELVRRTAQLDVWKTCATIIGGCGVLEAALSQDPLHALHFTKEAAMHGVELGVLSTAAYAVKAGRDMCRAAKNAPGAVNFDLQDHLNTAKSIFLGGFLVAAGYDLVTDMRALPTQPAPVHAPSPDRESGDAAKTIYPFGPSNGVGFRP